MKQLFIIIAMVAFTGSLFAQRQVRSQIKEGNKSYKENLYNAAEESYNKAIEMNPASTEALYNLANTYFRQGKTDAAVEAYQKYLQFEKENPAKMSMAWHNIGNSLLRKKDLQNSMEAYKNALRLNPDDDETRYNLAVVKKMVDDQNQQDQNQDQNKDQDKDQQDENKDQQDQNKDQQDQNKDKQDQQDQNQQQQMSQENIDQLLKAIEQQEKETQQKVERMKAEERKRQNEHNRKLNKDW